MNIGACWKRQDKNGKQYLSCVMDWPGEHLNFAIFSVDEKKSAKSPDYQIVWNPQKSPTKTEPIPDEAPF